MVAGPLDGQRFGHPRQTRLGHGVERGAIAAIVEGTDGRDVDHAARLPGLDQPPRDLAGQHPGPAQIGVEHRVDQFVCHLVSALGVGDAGVVDQNGDGPQRGLHGIHHLQDAGAIGHVEMQLHALAAIGANLLGQRLQTLDAAAGDGDPRAAGRQHPGKATTEPGRRAGDQGDLIGQVDGEMGKGIVAQGRLRMTG